MSARSGSIRHELAAARRSGFPGLRPGFAGLGRLTPPHALRRAVPGRAAGWPSRPLRAGARRTAGPLLPAAGALLLRAAARRAGFPLVAALVVALGRRGAHQ